MWIGLASLFGFAALTSFKMLTAEAESARQVSVKTATDGSAGGRPAVTQLAVDPAGLSTVFRTVSKAVKPAVVSISVTEKVAAKSPFSFFGGAPEDAPNPDQPRTFRQRGTGSGFIISPDGFIVTNDHVVGKADKISVELSDGRTFSAKRIGTDPKTDIAVIKIDAQGLTYIDNFLNVEKMDQVVKGMDQGDWVIAIGSPFGLEHTITAGIISAMGRDLFGRTASQFNSYIQTDASINPGNSGGPLVNLKGEVIGVNTLIFSESGGNEGIGFAIPSDRVSKIAKELIEKGRVDRGWLGVSLATQLSLEAAKAQGLPGNEGALVNDVIPDTPAARAGIRSGDFITRFDGRTVKSGRDLTNVVADTPVGKSVDVTVIRDGKETTIRVTIALRTDDEERRGQQPEQRKEAKLGLSSSTVTPQIAGQLKLKIPTGALVETVASGSPAEEAGLRRGDVIHQINRQPVASADDLQRIIRDLPAGSTVVLQVESSLDGQRTMRFVTIQLD